jgi:pimeloyl-ACP methyl ester carboxylesterase
MAADLVSTFVLLHGAWHGGWCWSRVASVLREEGHTVFSPTFTGVSDRAHVLSRGVGLKTHISDVTSLIDAEGLDDVVLVGHSYAGMVIAGVAEARPDALRVRVHLDAFVPVDGEAAIDLLPAIVAQHYHGAVAGPGFGWLIPPRSLGVLGVSEQADLDWLTPRLTPQPWATYADRIALTDAEASVPGAFIECVDWMRVFQSQGERARSRGWQVDEISTGHEAMVTAPTQLAALLAVVGGR